MDSKKRRRVWAAVLVVGAVWAFLRRPTVTLAIVYALYCSSERIFGVAPLKMYELGEIVASKPEAALAAAGTVVAVASMLAFKRVKRLDLELAAAADISLVLKDGMDMMTRLRGFATGVYEVRQLLLPFNPECQMEPEEARRRMDEITARWTVLHAKVPLLRTDQSEMWQLSSRILDIERQHGVVIKARMLAPYALSKAQPLALQMAEKAGFHLPAEQDSVGFYLDCLEVYGGISIPEFLEADEKVWTRFLEWMGAASAIGSSSIALPSAVTAARTAWTIARLRD
ncbi:hypothetical protein [Stenotrophomonas maltophilia]|uniref:hypothetical protein n=1 Tax=Stenotrophomonas maltophilia TaxID=40324 RepID=UPI0015DE633E|nr:hypothetical protein [Stenotrophomonas maltophilia]